MKRVKGRRRCFEGEEAPLLGAFWKIGESSRLERATEF